MRLHDLSWTDALHGAPGRHLGGTPGLAAAPTAGEPVVVTPDSDLGGHLREWSTSARRASWTLNHEGGRMTDEERARGHLTRALAATFRSELSR
ncbi:hypothetical protein GCM10011609_48700 [Lentzea pudingi]|uniref:Uncharacterized protein n=1 Tax=Lentzea pudingi TaxID=1789439 RepID=A0ABQ2ICK6_9PSEU|nr:hypothetical protein [Lentzea pudingi]GGN03847.1 hypothetical protein GCM10011609_48700 [Lentzea pudingi]